MIELSNFQYVILFIFLLPFIGFLVLIIRELLLVEIQVINAKHKAEVKKKENKNGS